MLTVVAAMVLVLATTVGSALAIFGLRRIVFSIAALRTPRPLAPPRTPPSFLVLVAARNEGDCVGSLLSSLDRIDHPDDRLEVTLVDDGSTDGTGAILARWADGRPRSRTVTMSGSSGRAGGKSAALAAGLAGSPRTDLVAVIDADFEVLPDGLRCLTAGFSNPGVGAVSGYVRPRNAEHGVVARYAALESWLHQLVTSAAKDRLGLDPPTIGIWVVRRDVLDAMGGFPSCVTGEDVRVAAAIARHGYRTRFVATEVGSNTVAATLAEYWWQHLRWARDVYSAERPPASAGKDVQAAPTATTLASFGRAIERHLSASGYADRLALVAGVVLTVLGPLPSTILCGYLGAVVIEILVATYLGGSRRLGETLRVLAAAATMVAVDVIATAVATVRAAIGTDPSWRRPERRPDLFRKRHSGAA